MLIDGYLQNPTQSQKKTSSFLHAGTQGWIQRGCYGATVPRFQTMAWEQQLGTFLKSQKQVRVSPLPFLSLLSGLSPPLSFLPSSAYCCCCPWLTGGRWRPRAAPALLHPGCAGGWGQPGTAAADGFPLLPQCSQVFTARRKEGKPTC